MMEQGDFESRIGYAFRDRSLLLAALTHRSYSHEHSGENNQRLEFLGDAILDFVIADVMYRRHPDEQEGDLSKRRSRLVCEDALAHLARKLGFGEFLRLGKCEITADGGHRAGTLADAYEAVIGAIYLDGGIEPATAFIMRHHAAFLDDPGELGAVTDAKSRLQECAQAVHKSVRYETLGRTGPEHAPTFEMAVYIDDKCIGRGTGKNKKDAQKAAAEDALSHLDGID